MPDVSGVGISFGADRIYDVMSGLNLFPEYVDRTTKILFLNLGEKEVLESLRIAESFRDGWSCEVYPDAAKMKKQMEYANRRQIPYVVIIGSNELAEGKATLKKMESGEQICVPVEELRHHIL